MPTACTAITCPSTCADPMPPVDDSLCNPVTNVGEIAEILYTNVGNPLTDETDPAEWATRMALLDANPAKIHRMYVKGEKPEPEGDDIEIENGVKVSAVKVHNINAERFQTSQINYEAMRKMECPRKYLIWYITSGGLLYGGNTGIEANMKQREVIPASRRELIKFNVNVNWESKISPCRTTSPI